MKLLYILELFLSGPLLGVSLWNLDWAIWRHDFYLYYPSFFWHVRASEVYGLRFWVNIQYFQIAIAFILAITCTYKLTKECNSYNIYMKGIIEPLKRRQTLEDAPKGDTVIN